MLKWVVAASVLVGTAAGARAEISQDLKFCAGLKISKERLACYDAAARIEGRKDLQVERAGTAVMPRTATSNAMAYAPPPVATRSRFDGAYVGVTGGWDIAATTLRDPTYSLYYFPEIPSDAIAGAKVGLVGGYNVTIDRMLVGMEGRWQHNYSVATASNGYSSAGQTPPFVTYNSINSFTVLDSSINTTRLSHPDQLDFSVRAGILFGDLMVFGKVGAGIESTKMTYTADRRQAVDCVSPIIQPVTMYGYTNSQVTGCAATANGTITSSSRNSINPVAIFGGGVEYNYGNVFARIEAEMIAHFVSDYGASGYTPGANFTVGYRF